MFALPSSVTLMGHALTLAWLCGAPWFVGIVGLAFDILDGMVARKFNASTEYGSLYDWTVDVTCAAIIADRLHVTLALACIVPLQVWLRRSGKHVSGRAALVAVAIVVAWTGR
jgi:phosphatidylglycerophosphate synthase